MEEFIPAVCVLIIPVMILILGIYFYRNPPKEINSYSGYRTAWSEKSMDTWIFANKLMGRIYACAGGAMTVITAVIEAILISKDMIDELNPLLIITFSQIGIILLAIIPVEVSLRKTFDENGVRKQ